MGIVFTHRASASPFIERVWHGHSDAARTMTSIATAHWTLVTWRTGRHWQVAVQGPETAATTAPVPPDTEFVGIRMSLGTTLATRAAPRLVDHGIAFPDVTRRSVRILGHAMPLPTYDDAEDLVRRLTRAGAVGHDPLVRGCSPDVGERTVRRRFVAATGLTPGAARRIQRAREAAAQLRTGAPIATVAHDLGYYDQPHLARSLGRFIGHTAAALRTGDSPQLSVLYKTRPDAAS